MNDMHVEAKLAFNKKYGIFKNIMTPYVIEYGQSGLFYYEISANNENSLYGVSVLPISNPFNLDFTDMNKSFSTRKEAYAYMERLKNE